MSPAVAAGAVAVGALKTQVFASAGPAALPGRWREVGGLDDLVLLDTPARTAGMVLVARAAEDWQRRPELRFAVWPDDLEPMP
jgi:hypothetical protein